MSAKPQEDAKEAQETAQQLDSSGLDRLRARLQEFPHTPARKKKKACHGSSPSSPPASVPFSSPVQTLQNDGLEDLKKQLQETQRKLEETKKKGEVERKNWEEKHSKEMEDIREMIMSMQKSSTSSSDSEESDEERGSSDSEEDDERDRDEGSKRYSRDDHEADDESDRDSDRQRGRRAHREHGKSKRARSREFSRSPSRSRSRPRETSTGKGKKRKGEETRQSRAEDPRSQRSPSRQRGSQPDGELHPDHREKEEPICEDIIGEDDHQGFQYSNSQILELMKVIVDDYVEVGIKKIEAHQMFPSLPPDALKDIILKAMGRDAEGFLSKRSISHDSKKWVG